MAANLAVFRRRLSETQRFSELPPSGRYALAASTLDDDVLEQAGVPFGAPFGESGFGTSDVLTELLSRDPKYVKVDDLKSHQQSLVNMGYAYDVPVDGQWSPYWAASDRRASRDAFDTIKGGGSFMSASVGTVMKYLSYTLPSEVFKGIYGIADGIVKDFATSVTHPVEVFEEGGALGGAAVGAGIGASVGLLGGPLTPITSTAGAIIGGALGGVAGFFGDFFDDDENETGTFDRILGSLSPIDEMKSGDAKNLFAALSTIMTASAILKSASVAAQGVKTAQAGIGAGVAETGDSAFRVAFTRAAKGTVEPGLLGQIGRASLKRPIVGSAFMGGVINSAPELLTGDFGKAAKDFAHGAIAGGTIGALGGRSKAWQKTSSKLIEGINAAPLMRIAASPAGKVTQALYTGAVGPTIVAQAVAEVSGKSGTAIGAGIESAPEIPGPKIAGINVLDLTLGAIIYPERLLPWRGQDIATAMKGLGSNHELLPLARAIAATEGISLSKAIVKGRDLLGKNHLDGSHSDLLVAQRNTEAYYQSGLDDAVEAYMKTAKIPDDPEIALKMWESKRASLHAEVKAEAGDLGNIAGTSPKAAALIDAAKSNPQKMENYWRDAIMDNGGPEFASVHQKTEEFLQGKPFLDGTGAVSTKTATPAVKDVYLTAQDYERWGGKGDELGEYERLADSYRLSVKAANKTPETAAKGSALANPETAVAAKAGLAKQRTSAGAKLDDFLVGLKKRQVIDEAQYGTLRPGIGTDYRIDHDFIKKLRGSAKLRPREIPELTAELAAQGGGMERYIAVATGENLVNYSEFSRMAEINGITEYSRTQHFWDAIASTGIKVDRADLGRLRYQEIAKQLGKKAELFENPMSPKEMAAIAMTETRSRYDPKYAALHGEKVTPKLGGSLVTRETPATGRTKTEIFKISPNDLTPEDILKAFDLETPGVLKTGIDPYQAAHEIKRAIHVGSAFGADIAHPIATARAFAAGLRTTGLPEFGEFIRTATVIPTKWVLKTRFKKGSYGYLPQNTRRMYMALQFGLNPMFDISRYMEGAMFGKFRGGDIPLSFTAYPKKAVNSFEGGFTHPLTGEHVAGEAAVRAATEFGDMVIYGRRGATDVFDELAYRLVPNGIAHFKPRQVENAQALWLGSRTRARVGRDLNASELQDIREKVMQINQYGTKQTAFGNTAHMLFFPFLFTRKQLSAVVDFTLAAPARNLLVHEGLRRWYEVSDDESVSSKFAAFMEKHIPLAKELERINNFAYGMSPGRFFLEGVMDKDITGKVTQGIASFMLPGGVLTPVADVAGQTADVLKNFFIPVLLGHDGKMMVKDGKRVMTGDAMLNIAKRLAPAYRDIDRWFMNEQVSGSKTGLVGAQITALGSAGSPYTQMGDYLDTKNVMGATLEGTAKTLGFSSWESLRSSDPALAAQVDEIDSALGEMFPQGKELAQTFTNADEIKDQTIYAINNKDGARTAAEEAVSAIGMVEQQMKIVAGEAGKSQDEMFRLAAPLIRSFAAGYSDDRQFMALWTELFQAYYGPLRVSVAA